MAVLCSSKHFESSATAPASYTLSTNLALNGLRICACSDLANHILQFPQMKLLLCYELVVLISSTRRTVYGTTFAVKFLQTYAPTTTLWNYFVEYISLFQSIYKTQQFFTKRQLSIRKYCTYITLTYRYQRQGKVHWVLTMGWRSFVRNTF